MLTYAIAGGGYLKIGRSKSLPQRSRQVCNGVPFRAELLGHVDADIEADTIAELKRAGLHTRGEWFVLHPAALRILRLRGFFDN